MPLGRRTGAPGAETPEVDARLRSLGYVSGSAAPKAQYTERDDPKRLVEIDRLMKEAVSLDEQGSLGEAIALYRRILTQRPDMMAASRHLGSLVALDLSENDVTDAGARALTATLAARGVRLELRDNEISAEGMQTFLAAVKGERTPCGPRGAG